VPRFGIGTPPGTSDARSPGNENWLGSGTGRPGTVGRFSCPVGTTLAAPVVGAGTAGAAGCGKLTAALATGGGATGVAGVAGTPVRADAAFCSNWGTLAGEAAACCTMSMPGTLGVVGVTGSAPAMGLNARTAENRPAAAPATVTTRMLVRDMVLPIRSKSRTEPKVSCY